MHEPIGHCTTSQTLKSNWILPPSFLTLIFMHYQLLFIATTKPQVCKNDDVIERNVVWSNWWWIWTVFWGIHRYSEGLLYFPLNFPSEILMASLLSLLQHSGVPWCSIWKLWVQICIECLLYLPCSVDTILSNNDLVSTLLELTVVQEILTLDKS